MTIAEKRRAHYCLDCRWLRLQVDFDGGPNFACVKGRLDCGDEILWRTPCSDFDPGCVYI